MIKRILAAFNNFNKKKWKMLCFCTYTHTGSSLSRGHQTVTIMHLKIYCFYMPRLKTATRGNHLCHLDLTWFRMGLFGAAHGWGGHEGPNLPKEDAKNIWITWHTPWLLLKSAFLHRKLANFAISENTNIDCSLVYNF